MLATFRNVPLSTLFIDSMLCFVAVVLASMATPHLDAHPLSSTVCPHWRPRSRSRRCSCMPASGSIGLRVCAIRPRSGAC